MKSKLMTTVLIGALVQALALVAFCSFAKMWPESSWKLAGVALLALGSVGAVVRMVSLTKKEAMLGLLLLSIAAPVILGLGSFAFPGVMKDTDFFSVGYLVTGAKIAGLAFIGYGVAWGAMKLLRRAAARPTAVQS